MDTDQPQAISQETLMAIEGLGNDLDTILSKNRAIFPQYLDALRDLAPTLTRFQMELAKCKVAF
jgi:hypothetical protein